jgi:phosphate-selective porin OprO/OprP
LEKHVAHWVVFSAAVFFAAASHAGTELTPSWSDGLTFQSADKSFKLKVGGRIMNDWAWFSQSDSNIAEVGNMQDGTEFRRAWLSVSGTLHDYVLFKAEYDFAGAAKAGKEVAMKDVYMGIRGIPYVGTLQMGHQKEPFGLEVLTSSNNTTFMERALIGAFIPERNTGVRQNSAYFGDRVTLMTGIFRDTDNGGRNSSDGHYAGTARLTGLPWSDEENGGLFHIGAAYSYRNPSDDVSYESRSSAHLATNFVGVEGPADAVNLFGCEGAVCYGPFRAQGEYVMSSVDAEIGDDVAFQGYYVYGAALVSGERYGYKKSDAVFEAVKPKKSFRQDGAGVGAWEIGVRYSFLDLNDKQVYGGELTDITVGLNWYLTSTARMMFNYVYAKVENVYDDGRDQGTANMFQARFHVFF